MSNLLVKAVYTVVECNGKKRFVRIGSGFVNHDGSISLRLDALPINGTMQVRDFIESAESLDKAPTV